MENRNNTAEDITSGDKEPDQPVRLVIIPAPEASEILTILDAVGYKGFFHKEDIDYVVNANEKPCKSLCIVTMRRTHIKTYVEEEMVIERVTDALQDMGYINIATYDCGKKWGSRLLLEKVYKKL